jgi:hypothetical protein
MTGFAIPGDMALNATETDCEFVEGLAAVAQQIQTGLQVFASTWHYDRNAGIDYIEKIFVSNPDLRGIRLVFWDFLLGVLGVTDVTKLDLRVDPIERALFVSFVVRTEFGPLSETVALQFPT